MMDEAFQGENADISHFENSCFPTDENMSTQKR